jgi:pyocin large subunit-like protein
MLAAEHCNSDILGMIIMKMLNDELENKVIVRDKLKSEAIMKLKNNQEEDVLTIAIMARSKE